MFTVQYVKNLQWADAEHTMFTCVVKYEEFNEEHPSGINAADPYAHIQKIWAKGNAGEYGVIAEYVPPISFDPIETSIVNVTPTENAENIND